MSVSVSACACPGVWNTLQALCPCPRTEISTGALQQPGNMKISLSWLQKKTQQNTNQPTKKTAEGFCKEWDSLPVGYLRVH